VRRLRAPLRKPRESTDSVYCPPPDMRRACIPYWMPGGASEKDDGTGLHPRRVTGRALAHLREPDRPQTHVGSALRSNRRPSAIGWCSTSNARFASGAVPNQGNRSRFVGVRARGDCPPLRNSATSGRDYARSRNASAGPALRAVDGSGPIRNRIHMGRSQANGLELSGNARLIMRAQRANQQRTLSTSGIFRRCWRAESQSNATNQSEHKKPRGGEQTAHTAAASRRAESGTRRRPRGTFHPLRRRRGRETNRPQSSKSGVNVLRPCPIALHL
jgi:hypothetical protein